MAETLSTFSLKPGDPAPDFKLPDPSGESHELSSVLGKQGLLVIFACNHCPYVVMLADIMGTCTSEWVSKGIGVVAISSNDVENYPQDGPGKMLEFARDSGWDFPYLYDESQEVAKAYGAACTPDFFLFNADRSLYYAGQFDDSRPNSGRKPDGADLRVAIEAMISDRSAPEKQLPSSGCNIKWKPGNEPAYFG